MNRRSRMISWLSGAAIALLLAAWLMPGPAVAENAIEGTSVYCGVCAARDAQCQLELHACKAAVHQATEECLIWCNNNASDVYWCQTNYCLPEGPALQACDYQWGVECPQKQANCWATCTWDTGGGGNDPGAGGPSELEECDENDPDSIIGGCGEEDEDGDPPLIPG